MFLNPHESKWPILTLVCVLLLFVAGPSASAEELRIEIDGGAIKALPIAIVPFALPANFPQDLAKIIESDLSMSGKFSPMMRKHMISTPSLLKEVNFKDWRLLGIENLVIGRVDRDGSKLVVNFSLIDVYRGTELLARRIPVSIDQVRKAAHLVSDIVYAELLGKRGDFGTKIAYVTLDREGGEYQLVIADLDGHDPRPILKSPEPLLSPAWSPDGLSLAYVSFEDGRSAIFVQDLKTRARRKIRLGGGINGSPAFSPDGDRLVITSSRDGNPDLFVYSLLDQSVKKITAHPAIDTEGHWSPDGRGLVFTSDRSGGAQIYYVGLDGSSPRRVTFEMGDYNANAEYSGDGQRLVMISRGGRGHRVAVLNLATGESRFLSDSILDESPSFSPNGDMVIYSSKVKNVSRLIAVSTDGNMVARKFTLGQSEIREPAWGPRID